MKLRLLVCLTLLIGCTTPSRIQHGIPLAERNKDVFVLSLLIEKHLKKTNGRTLNLSELVSQDSLGRINNSFDSLKLIPRGGYIAVYYRFSKSRDETKVRLTAAELDYMNKTAWRWTAKRYASADAGEIRFAYGERFYHIKKYIVAEVK